MDQTPVCGVDRIPAGLRFSGGDGSCCGSPRSDGGSETATPAREAPCGGSEQPGLFVAGPNRQPACGRQPRSGNPGQVAQGQVASASGGEGSAPRRPSPGSTARVLGGYCAPQGPSTASSGEAAAPSSVRRKDVPGATLPASGSWDQTWQAYRPSPHGRSGRPPDHGAALVRAKAFGAGAPGESSAGRGAPTRR